MNSRLLMALGVSFFAIGCGTSQAIATEPDTCPVPVGVEAGPEPDVSVAPWLDAGLGEDGAGERVCAVPLGTIAGWGDSLTLAYPSRLSELIDRRVDTISSPGKRCEEVTLPTQQYDVVIVGCGTVDLNQGHTADEVSSAIDNAVARLRPWAGRVLVLPIPRMRGTVALDVYRARVNARNLVKYGTEDIESDYTIGGRADPSDPAVYIDGYHFTAVGTAVRAETAYASLVRCPP